MLSHRYYKLHPSVIVASITLLLTLCAPVSAIDRYATTTFGEAIMSGYGECLQSTGGRAVACGEPVVVDTDGDGVSDGADQCPRSPNGVRVDAKGCPLDQDGDGVPDYRDKCLNSHPGDTVTVHGCLDEIVLRSINFQFNSAELTARAKQTLSATAKSLKGRPDIRNITVVGHTDSDGEAEYNQKLSESRATAVMDYFRAAGVTLPMKAVGKGESAPVAGNGTTQGKAMNRRVELNLN